MATKPRTTQSRITNHGSQATALADKLGKDASTVINPYARPAGRATRSASVCELPEIVDHTGDCALCGRRHDVRFAEGRGEEYADDNPLAWTLYYRNEYESGEVDEWCRYQKVIAPTEEHEGREKAILTLLTLRRGNCRRLHLFRVDAPPTAAERQAACEANHRMAQQRRRGQ